VIFQETELKGAFLITIEKRFDERGFFGRSWCKREFGEHGLNSDIVQTNYSYSKIKGTLRGMHYQVAPHAETKTIRVISGSIFDVIIDLRPTSPTYKKWLSFELSAENGQMLYIPEGFAHGFFTLEDHTAVNYMVTAFYSPGAELGIKYDDPKFSIAWPGKPSIISEKDNTLPLFND
jgi:dTDP-4-dehydrorhamnose 3,5-epimerase